MERKKLSDLVFLHKWLLEWQLPTTTLMCLDRSLELPIRKSENAVCKGGTKTPTRTRVCTHSYTDSSLWGVYYGSHSRPELSSAASFQTILPVKLFASLTTQLQDSLTYIIGSYAWYKDLDWECYPTNEFKMMLLEYQSSAITAVCKTDCRNRMIKE